MMIRKYRNACELPTTQQETTYLGGTRANYEVLDDSRQWLVVGESWCLGLEVAPLWRTVVAHILCSVCTLGIPYLLMAWYPSLRARLFYSRVDLSFATTVLIKSTNRDVVLCPVLDCPVRHFDYQLHRYVWNLESMSFVLLKGSTGTLAQLLESNCGLSPEQRHRLSIYGENKITIKVKSYLTLFIDEVLNPFYIFELFSAILWSFDEYYYYAGCVIVLSLFSIIMSLIQTKKQLIMLRAMVSTGDKSYVTVINEKGDNQIICSSELVPGDLILIPPHGCLMTCDALIMTGTCIVNESVLTGESTPVTKTPALYQNEEYDPTSIHSRHTLYGGTQIIQTRFYHHDKVTAKVVRTGSMTAKGQLIRSILFPKNIGFDFYRDAIRFVFVLFVVSAIGCGYSIYIFVSRGAGLETILLRSLDIITIVVPPALPAAMTVGTVYSQNRLKKSGIFCTAPSRINIAGKVKLVCFDKTGTLTEEGLTVWGILRSEGRTLLDLHDDPSQLPVHSPILQAMAACHSLTKIDSNLCGDPLDLSMFESTHWLLEEPGTETNRFDMLAPTIVRPGVRYFRSILDPSSGNGRVLQVPLEIGIVRQFPFNSNAQCMSVITRTLGASHMTLYTKGAPEKIQNMCLPGTVPDNMSATLSYYTSAGFRVIAIACKELPKKFRWTQAQRVTREQVEEGMTFLGLLLMQNTLKPQSAPVIRQLQAARIKCLMLTGDNMLTAVSVSRNCGLVSPTTPLSQLVVTKTLPHIVRLQALNSSLSHTELDSSSALAVDGSTWTQICLLFPQLVPQVATRGVVFARMSPQQKAHVVETLQSLDYVVAMIGDGANDCGALKAAHVGVSLSAAEASIAAPFTSTQKQDISCLPQLIAEGRCSLVTSFGIFNFMALYSLAQFSSVLLLYPSGVEMGNMEFLYVDLVITTSLAVFMGRSKPSSGISQLRPLTALASPLNVIPLLLHIATTFLIQYLSLFYLRHQPWFVPVHVSHEDETIVTCWENAVVFLVSTYQYVILAIVNSKGKPHRESFVKNLLMVFLVICLTSFNTILLLFPLHELTYFFELEPISADDMNFRAMILLFTALHLFSALFIEQYVADSFWLKWCLHKLLRKNKYKNKYKTVETLILS